MIATACCPAERNQTLPPTTPAKAARIASHGRMLNDPTLPPAAREKKKQSATAAITASTDHRNQNQNFTDNCNYGASNETQDQLPLAGASFAFTSSFIIDPSAFLHAKQRLAAALG